MKNINLIYLLILSIFSCQKNTDNDLKKVQQNSIGANTFSTYNKQFLDKKEIKKLITNIKEKGDTIAFIKLKEIYYNSGHKSEFLYYSLYMANTYNYKYAYYTNYSLLMNDIVTKENYLNNVYANYYLFKSHELGYKYALGTIEERFGTTLNIPKSSDYLIKNLKSDNIGNLPN